MELLQSKKKETFSQLIASQQEKDAHDKFAECQILLASEDNDNCSTVIFAMPLADSFSYKAAADSCNS